jgi:hypothetical protein
LGLTSHRGEVRSTNIWEHAVAISYLESGIHHHGAASTLVIIVTVSEQAGRGRSILRDT